jgi:hypothetical protein
MKEVHERVFVGNDVDCKTAPPAAHSSHSLDLAIVHACRTCHQRALGYDRSLPSTHANYLAFERGCDLYLNLIDPPVPLFRLESFERFLKFAAEHYSRGHGLLIHCNQGHSRAPSLALLFMSKKLGAIGNGSFNVARKDFESLFKGYEPGKGIEMFLKTHWQEL